MAWHEKPFSFHKTGSNVVHDSPQKKITGIVRLPVWLSREEDISDSDIEASFVMSHAKEEVL